MADFAEALGYGLLGGVAGGASTAADIYKNDREAATKLDSEKQLEEIRSNLLLDRSKRLEEMKASMRQEQATRTADTQKGLLQRRIEDQAKSIESSANAVPGAGDFVRNQSGTTQMQQEEARLEASRLTGDDVSAKESADLLARMRSDANVKAHNDALIEHYKASEATAKSRADAAEAGANTRADKMALDSKRAAYQAVLTSSTKELHDLIAAGTPADDPRLSDLRKEIDSSKLSLKKIDPDWGDGRAVAEEPVPGLRALLQKTKGGKSGADIPSKKETPGQSFGILGGKEQIDYPAIYAKKYNIPLERARKLYAEDPEIFAKMGMR